MKDDYAIEPMGNGFIVAHYHPTAGPQGARYYGTGGENSIQPMIRNKFTTIKEAESFIDKSTTTEGE